jgi:sulfatase maturation enzyme AslB (radical SAM superfamily)
MECKFIQHGLALSYDQIVKPCCQWKIDPAWRELNHVNMVKLQDWHTSSALQQKHAELKNNNWPSNCDSCEKTEAQGRADSMRGNGNHAYADYKNDDITLEIRPGSVCNFACQTCWPEASSRVAQYHHQAGLIDIKSVISNSYDDFDFLLPIKHRIRDVVLLGGEPFYDKSCRKFLTWAQDNLTANIMMFTNGSQIDFDFLKLYPGKLTLVFSIDAIGRPAEYVRFGTDWGQVLNNYQEVKKYTNIDVRVNITCSVYNYAHIKHVIDLLCQDWPSVVSFGVPHQSYLTEEVIPREFRPELIIGLGKAIEKIQRTHIESGQKSNAINALQAIINNLHELEWNQKGHTQLVDFVDRMDRVKNIAVKDYCSFLSTMLAQKVA